MTLSAPDRAPARLIATLALLLAGTSLAVAQQPAAPNPPAAAAAPATKPAPAAAEDSTKSAASYSLGVVMGSQLHNGGLRPADVNAERVTQGLRDALSGKVKTSDSDRQNLDKLMHGAYDSLVDVNHRAAAKFLAANSKKPDVVTTASGLQYKVLSAGSGDAPKASDEVVVNYRGALLDGTEFDSSYKHGQPVTLGVGHVIPGWTEALQLMKPGAKYQLWIPPQLAYDTRVPPGAPIPPGAMLIFDVELLSIKPPAAPAPTPAAPGSPPPK
jgi:FKBP-type peptidyl-prolyl cis-trans isomerase